jgi:hypothetical protein
MVDAMSGATCIIDVARSGRFVPKHGVTWLPVEGLGRRRGAIMLSPRTNAPSLRSPDQLRESAPVAEYPIEVVVSDVGEAEAIVEALPTQPITPAHALIVGVSIDDAPPAMVTFEQANDELDKVWQQNAIRNAMFGRVKLTLPEGSHTFKLWGADPSVTVQRVTVHTKPLPASYLGPPDPGGQRSASKSKPASGESVPASLATSAAASARTSSVAMGGNSPSRMHPR